jgi:thioredoxin 1
MKKAAWIILALVMGFGVMAISCSTGGSDSDVPAVTDSSFEKEVKNSDLPVLVDFWAPWCGPCRMYGPIVDQLARDYKGKLKVVRVDVDKNPSLAKYFQIRSIPFSVLIQKDVVVKTWIGLISEDELKIDVEKVVTQSQKESPTKI